MRAARLGAGLALVLALASAAAAGELGSAVKFSGHKLKSAAPPIAGPGGAFLETGPSDALTGVKSAFLFSGEAAPGAFDAELSVDEGAGPGEWRSAADGEVSAEGAFWFRFDASVPAGARVLLRFRCDGTPPAWVNLRVAEAVGGRDGAGSIAGAIAGAAGASLPPPPLGGAPQGAAPPDVTVRPRADWSALPNAQPYELMIPGGVSVHHTETESPRGEAAAAALVRSIQRFHQRGRGWSDIAYHFIIDAEGRVWEGRPGPVLGAHVKDRNDGNLGIALLGDFEDPRGVQPTPRQLESLHALAARQTWRWRIPTTRILGHRDQEQTACPGAALYARLGALRAEVDSRRSSAGAVAAGGTTP